MTIGVSTDHISGYTLSIKASDSITPGRLKNGNSYLQSIASTTSLSDFRNADLSNSNLATSLGLSDCSEITETSNCKGIWGYKPSKLDSANNVDFLPTPGTSGRIIDVTSEPNQTTNEYEVTLGAKVSPFATVGSYTNVFVFAVVGNNIPFTMEFSENTVENMPVNILDGSSNDATATIPSGTTNTPTRSGYKFTGWCDQPTTKSGNNDTCASGHSYKPGGTILLNQTGANNIKLYAMWEKEICTGYTTMQSLSSSNIGTLLPNIGSTATVCDARDETKYVIGKLADDNYWMLDNLALDLTNSTILNDMDESNTNASNTTLGYLKGTTTGTTSDQYATAAVSNWTSSYSYSAPLVNMDSKNLPTSGDTNISGVDTTSWKYGGYYNYCAASAGSYCYGNGTSYGTSSGNATEDICPKGWRLPTGNTSGEFQNLYSKYSSASPSQYTAFRTALRLPLSGYFYDGSARLQGSYGYWWSSTRSNNYGMYYLYANTSGINPAGGSYRYGGYSVRCVLGS
ncbi:hypothetical protein IJH23_03190 [Candidatus Saccharibacteria bacterium]|nr:hypothetical protein [Candidatus Saccharibacteria bacterium]